MNKKEIRSSKTRPYDVIVCGAGHAGCEAALAAARMGGGVLMLTGNLDTIAQMSCNPAIGGQAKGHIVREIDALGGEMGVCADVSGIHYRLLNASKGAAVQAPRTQCDKKAYQYRMKHLLEINPNITMFQAMVDELIFDGDKVVGVKTNLQIDFYAKTIVVTTGTFLRGLMHIGKNKNEGGRMGDFSAKGLTKSFLDAGIQMERLKTGTPPRILGGSIDFSKCEKQPGDKDPVLFGFYDTRDPIMFHVEHYGQQLLGWAPGSDQVSCWVTSTSKETGELIHANLDKSPMYSGEIESSGPRYCPSIEDKYVRFSGKEEHRIFLEPEGRNTDEWYINGFSTCLPLDVQLEALRTIVGLENAVMIRPAYAVEYDFAIPTQLYPSLESKKVENLFFAGQINGTSGYEEAGCQGLLAGANALAKSRGLEPLIVGRDEGYMGVLIDDLVTKGTSEPYRMFTSRAEHRLTLNHGSAELRLWKHAKRLGLVNAERAQKMEEKANNIQYWIDRFEKETTKGGTWADAIRRNPLEALALPEDFEGLSLEQKQEVIYRVKYKGYLDRETRMMDKMRHMDKIKIPESFDFNSIKGLRKESAEKLCYVRPQTLGQANRISGVNPADISLIMIALAKDEK